MGVMILFLNLTKDSTVFNTATNQMEVFLKRNVHDIAKLEREQSVRILGILSMLKSL